jgi:hypothetical protein
MEYGCIDTIFITCINKMDDLIKSMKFALFGLVVSTLLMMRDPKFSLKNYHFWPSVFFSYFLSYFVFETMLS